MLRSPVPRGLICCLAMIENPPGSGQYQVPYRLLPRLAPAVDGLLLDPMFWSPRRGQSAQPVPAALLEEILGALPSNLCLWVRITGNNPEQTIHIRRQLEEVCYRLRYSGPLAWVDTPLYYHSNRGLPQHYQHLLQDSEFPLLLDNDPQAVAAVAPRKKRRNIRTAVLKRLADNPAIVGLVHRGDLRRGLNYQRAVRHRPEFRIYDGSEDHFLKSPSTTGVVSVGANLIPEDWRAIAQASLSLDESSKGITTRFTRLWEAGGRVRSLLRIYRVAPTTIIPATLAARRDLAAVAGDLPPAHREAVQQVLTLMADDNLEEDKGSHDGVA